MQLNFVQCGNTGQKKNALPERQLRKGVQKTNHPLR